MSDDVFLQEYEYLFGALAARANGNSEKYEAFMAEIRQDVSNECGNKIDKKIERWLNVTRIQMWRKSQSVEFYTQAKMLYRDGFFEATIMMARSVCEMVCYELLDKISHPFGTREDVEKQNFRKLARHIHDNAGSLPTRTFDLLNEIYDIGNNYIHPKANQNPTEDSRICLLKLGEALWGVFGVTKEDLQRSGVTIQTAYAAFPEICTWYGFPMDVFATIEAAEAARQHNSADSES